MRGPVQRVHIDQSYKAGFDRVRHHLPEEADQLLQGRSQIINVWRPIKPIFKDPLGVADARSVWSSYTRIEWERLLPFGRMSSISGIFCMASGRMR